MQLATIGLGRMGGNMTERLMRDERTLVAYDRDAAVVTKYEQMDAKGAKNLVDMLPMRLRSRWEDSFGGTVIAALRNEFGGHAVTS